MIALKQTVVVEGKYDKIRLSGVLDAEIVTTDGFGIFKNKEKLNMLRRMAEKNGIIILTDSDSAGFLIRNHLCGSIPSKYITNVFIPEIKGKERRKAAPSAEGLLGVEGVDTQVIAEALKKAGVDILGSESKKTGEKITKADLFAAGLSGTDGSREKRERLAERLGLPKKMSPSQLVPALNSLYGREEFYELFETEQADE